MSLDEFSRVELGRDHSVPQLQGHHSHNNFCDWCLLKSFSVCEACVAEHGSSGWVDRRKDLRLLLLGGLGSLL